MIPKKIHYCWFGGAPMPRQARKCLRSWKKHCPDYEIVRWDESNFDLENVPDYVREAYDAGKWAFVTDYVRLKVVYDEGGIYFDTDVEALKSFDDLLDCQCFFGFQCDDQVATGLGFGAVKGSTVIAEMMALYDGIHYISGEDQDMTPCPVYNTEVLERHGLVLDGSYQVLDGDIAILPEDYLCPLSYFTNKLRITDNTYSIHWYSASWWTPEKRREKQKAILKNRVKDFIGPGLTAAISKALCTLRKAARSS